MKTPLTSHAVRVGGFFVMLYVLCLVWPMIYPYGADVLTHHLLSLKLLFPGFQGFDAGSILLGGALSFVYGFAGSLAFHSLHNDCCIEKK